MKFPGYQQASFPSSCEACAPALTIWQVVAKPPIPPSCHSQRCTGRTEPEVPSQPRAPENLRSCYQSWQPNCDNPTPNHLSASPTKHRLEGLCLSDSSWVQKLRTWGGI